MKFQGMVVLIMFVVLCLFCAGCESEITVPYSSGEYENGEWTAEKLVQHFKELGFYEVVLEEYTTFEENNVHVQVVVAEDAYAFSPQCRDFEKGEKIGSVSKVIVRDTVLVTSVSGCYVTKRDRQKIYIVESAKKIYSKWESSDTWSISEYEGSILDLKDNGLKVGESYYKIDGNYIRQYSQDGIEWRSFSIIDYNKIGIELPTG